MDIPSSVSQAAHRPVKGQETSTGRALSCEGPQPAGSIGPAVCPLLDDGGKDMGVLSS